MRYKLRRTTLMTVFCLSLVSGIALAAAGAVLPGFYLLALLPCIFVVKKRTILALGFIVLAGLSIGVWRGSVVWERRDQYEKYFDRKLTFTVQSLDDAVYGKGAQMEFAADHVIIEDIHLPGRVIVRGFGGQGIYRADKLEVTGKLRPGRGSVQGYVSFADLKIIEHPTNPIDSLRRRFVAGIQSVLPSPHASLGLGLLIGQRNLLPDDLNASLGRVGLAHIVAVSGYNLTILVNFVRRISGTRSKYQSLALSLALITLFLMMSGLSPSIIRAAIVSALSLLAWYYGRKVKPMVLIAIAAALTSMVQPLYVWGDMGWYLSFLAFFGVLVAAPIVLGRICGPSKPHALFSMLIETICAQLLTAPIIMMAFGKFSIIGLAANIAVVPIIPYAMALTAIAGLAGMFIPLLSGWFALPGRYLLGYMVEAVKLFDRLPFAAVEFKITAIQMVFLYSLLFIALFILYRKSAKITDINREF